MPYGLEAFSRTLVYLPAILLAGTVGYQWRYGTDGPSADRVRRLALGAAAILFLMLVVRAEAHALAAFGDEGTSWESFRLIAFESRWGGRWHWQLAAAMLALVTAAVSLRAPSAGFELSALSAAAVCFTLPLTGHGMVEGAFGIALQGIHAAGAGVWIGTLACLALTLPAESNREAYQRFAPVAAIGVLLVITTGVVVSFQRLSVPTDLWQSGYGRSLLVKLALVATVGACGAWNWRALRSRDGTRGTWILTELGFAVAVLAATGWLSESSPP